MVKLFLKLFFNVCMGVILATVLGVAPVYGIMAGLVIPMLIGSFAPAGVAREGVFTEVWTGTLVKQLQGGLTASWLNGLYNASGLVNNETLHLVDVGVDPDVLINNTTYPIASQDIQDGDIPIGLDKYQTKKTRITDDELYSLSYDKYGSIVERHGNAIAIAHYKKAAHALSPLSDTEKTPVIPTSGDADASGRKKLRREDIIALKRRLDANQIPEEGRRLVLCSDHVNDLLEQDQKFAEQYYNYTTGKIANMYGFEIYTFVNCPYYSKEGVKKTFGSEVEGTDHQASFFFYTKRAFYANGSTKMYYRAAETDPDNQETAVNFRNYFIAMPIKHDAYGAIYSWDGTTTQTKNQSAEAYKYWSQVRKEKMAEMAAKMNDAGEAQAAGEEDELDV